jgi:hypothetical protein
MVGFAVPDRVNCFLFVVQTNWRRVLVVTEVSYFIFQMS